MIQDQTSLVGREPEVRFSVRGLPVSQGQMTAFVPKGWNRAVVADKNRKPLEAWRSAIASAATTAMEARQAGPTLWPCSVEVVFTFPRLKVHLNSQGKPKTSAPRWKSTKPDIDKTARAVLDALSGVVYLDDSQVARLVVVKRYGEVPGVDVVVHYLSDLDQCCGEAYP
jgi:Holliday junction resolvase RusA-like endonuclease